MKKSIGKISISFYLLKFIFRFCVGLFKKVLDRIYGMAEVV